MCSVITKREFPQKIGGKKFHKWKFKIYFVGNLLTKLMLSKD